ncbi:MAG: hypothetical protein OXM55_07905 [Bdellovibrionales bacterium]|nr:hypothetical protein [Bdellovibrionales bacterium]
MMLKNNKGGMILLIAMSTALASMVGMSAYKVIKYTHESQVTRNKFSKYQLLTLSLRSLMSRPDVCTSALKDQKFDPSQSKIDVNIASTILKEQKFIQNIKDIENSKFLLLNNGFTNDKQLVSSSDILYTYRADLEVWLPQSKGELFFNYKNLNLRIPLYVNIDKDNDIKSCYGVYSQAAQCERYWKSWDESETDLDQKCNPDRQCILYSASTCAPPSVQIAIAGVQVSSSSSSTGGGTSGGGGGGSAMSEYVKAGRAVDTGINMISQMETIIKEYEKNLDDMKMKFELLKIDLDKIKTTLDTETQALQAAQAAYNSCMAPCAIPCSCPPRDPDDEDYSCGCPTCLCGAEAQAVSEAQERVNQVQTEFNEINANFNYLKDILQSVEKMNDINGYILALTKFEQDKEMYRLKLFHGKKFLKNVDEGILFLLKQDEGFQKIQSEKQRIGDKYFAGRDPSGSISYSQRGYLDHRLHGTITLPDTDAIQQEYNKIYTNYEMDKIPTEHGIVTHPKIDFRGLTVSSDPYSGTLVHHEITNLEKQILHTTEPSIKPPVPGGPVSLNDGETWRRTTLSFKEGLNKFRIHNQLLYSTISNHSGNNQPVNEFTSPSSSTHPIQTDMEYMCLWCNEHRKKRLVQDAEQDPVLNEMQVAQPQPPSP